MFEKYQATKKDFETIEEGIKTVWRKEMNFVFRDKDLIKNVVVISYDSKFLYLWTKIKLSKIKNFTCGLKGYQAYKIPHRVKVSDEMQMGWQANAYYFYQYLPKALLTQACFSGSLLTPFTKIHQKYIKDKKREFWAKAYSTYESYLATIIHEFSHIYYNSQPPSHSHKRANLRYLETALALYKKRRSKKLPEIKITPNLAFDFYTELFAFCSEYYTANLFWPNFQKDLEKYIIKAHLEWLIKHPSFLSSRRPHSLAMVFGKIILAKYPTTWPKVLLQHEDCF